MGDIDHCRLKTVVEFGEFRPHLDSKLCVQVRQRFIEEKHGRVPDNRPPHGYTLALPSRELPRFSMEKLLNSEYLCGLFDLLIDLSFGEFSDFKAETHIHINGLLGIEGVFLEDHGDIPIFWGKISHHLIIEIDVSGGRVFKTRNYTKNGRFATPRRPNQYSKLLVLDREVEILYRLHRPKIFRDIF